LESGFGRTGRSVRIQVLRARTLANIEGFALFSSWRVGAMSLGIVLSTELFSADRARVLLLIRVYWLVALKIILAGRLVSTRLATVNRSTGRIRRLGRRVSRISRR
jgi:hypothetical protein